MNTEDRPHWLMLSFALLFDSVYRHFLWLLLWSKCITEKVLEVEIEDLYSNTSSCVEGMENYLHGLRYPQEYNPGLCLSLWSLLGANTLGEETFTDLDFTNDVSLLKLYGSCSWERRNPHLCLESNPNQVTSFRRQYKQLSLFGHHVELVDSFLYVGSCIDTAAGSECDISRIIYVIRIRLKTLDRNF